MRWTVIASVLLPVAAAAQLPVDPAPQTFLPGGAGAEGCYEQWATRAAVRAYSAPTPASRPIRTIDGDRRVDANDYSESLTAVLQRGLVRALRPVEVRGARLGGGPTESIRLDRGDELEILADGPEESVYFAVGPAVYAGVVPGYYGASRDVEVVRRPVTELWVRLIEHAADRPAAWLNTAQAGMVPREAFCE